MGIAWCRERVEQAQNSKSPVDRILVRCSNMIKPKNPYSQSQGKVVRDFVYKGMRNQNLGSSYQVPVHAVPPRTRNRKFYDWQKPPKMADENAAPVPPPRKKRKRKVNSTEVLNNHLPELHSPGYVLYSENLLNKTFSNKVERNETDVGRPFEKSYGKKRRTLRHDRFGKVSRNRMRKIKTESYSNDEKDEGVKNDNKKKTERKIKHVSTVSLPNYNELIKRGKKVSADMENGDDKNGNQSAGLKLPPRNLSSISLPGEGSNSILSSLSEATIHCLETYMKRCRSFGSLKPQQLLEKLEEFNKTHRSPSVESSDSWSGLDDWDLGVIEYCDPGVNAPPLKPKSTKQGRLTMTAPASTTAAGTGTATAKKSDGRGKGSGSADSKGRIAAATPSTPEIIVTMENRVVPCEWFIDPDDSPLEIKAPTAKSANSSAGQRCTKTPPPSPEAEAVDDGDDGGGGSGGKQAGDETDGKSDVKSHKESDADGGKHSSLLKTLNEYKGNEGVGQETETETEREDPGTGEELANIVGNDSQKDSMNLNEVNSEVSSSKQNPNPLISNSRNRSNSFAEDKSRPGLPTAETPGSDRYKQRSASIALDCTTQLLRQLRDNHEAIEREIFQRPDELISRLRRESLFRSLPKDAFEAFEKKKTTHLRESLNDFLGFSESGQDRGDGVIDESCGGHAEKKEKSKGNNGDLNESKEKENVKSVSSSSVSLRDLD